MTVQTEHPEIRYGWIKLLYSCTAFLGLLVGGIMLFGPEKLARKVVGIPFMLPPEDPIVFGALGGIWFTIGILCCFGLRAPLKFLPIFMIQLIYKTFWFLCVFFPLYFRGEFPDYGWASVVGNLLWMALDLKAIPWRYMLSRELDPNVAMSEQVAPSASSRSALAPN